MHARSTSLAVYVGLVFFAHGRLEHEGRAQRSGPGQSLVGGAAADILVHREGRLRSDRHLNP
jgi:hypothetical protein